MLLRRYHDREDPYEVEVEEVIEETEAVTEEDAPKKKRKKREL